MVRRSRLLASASWNRTVKLWDAGSGTALRTLSGHSDWIWAMAFSPDGKLLASASDDRMVKLWDAGSKTALQTLEINAAVQTFSFFGDGTFVQINRKLLHTAFLSDGAAVSRPNLPRSVFVKKQWISLDMENLL
jgi:WD40 repeat protein